MKHRYSVYFLIFLTLHNANASNSVQDKARAQITQFDFMVGSWRINNKLMQADQSYIEKSFNVESKYTFDGLAIQSSWHEANSSNSYIGSVLNTYEPETETMVTSFFNALTSKWTENAASIEVRTKQINMIRRGKDQHGEFLQTTTFTIISKQKHTYKSERQYDDLQRILVTDSYVATRIN